MGRVKELYLGYLFFCGNCAEITEHADIRGHWECLECKRLEEEGWSEEETGNIK